MTAPHPALDLLALPGPGGKGTISPEDAAELAAWRDRPRGGRASHEAEPRRDRRFHDRGFVRGIDRDEDPFEVASGRRGWGDKS